MSEEETDPEPGADPDPDPERASKLRRAAELLGELEPSRSRDDTDAVWNDPEEKQQQQARDAYLRAEVPPHHGQA